MYIESDRWWRFLTTSTVENNISPGNVQTLLETIAVHENKTLHSWHIQGEVEDFSALVDSLSRLNGHILRFTYLKGNESGKADALVWPMGAVFIDFEVDEWVSIKVFNLDVDIFKKIIEVVRSFVKTVELITNKVYVIVRNASGGYKLSPVPGQAGVALERINYTDEVLGDFDHVVVDLKVESPCGRLIIIDGLPGTGKSYMVRALVGATKGMAFVLVPSHTLPFITSPEAINTFMGDEFSNGITFILEDADQCLVPRASDNVADISALLNLGDGIFGSMMDIRVVATTNAKRLEMDKALLRSGRLCKRIEVGLLQPIHASKIYRVLTKLDDFEYPSNKLIPLSDIYRDARERGWVPPERVLGKSRNKTVYYPYEDVFTRYD